MNDTERETERELQERCDRLVQHEVQACVSSIVERMFEHEFDLREDLENAYVRVCSECGEHVPHDADNDAEDEDGDEAWRCTCKALIDLDTVDSEPQEVFEWWIVSNWLANHLRQRGYVIHDDLYGLTVWGRCTTGQAISIDWVIRDIVRELYAERAHAS